MRENRTTFSLVHLLSGFAVVHRTHLFMVGLLGMAAVGCSWAPLAPYDQQAYANATTLKAFTLAYFDDIGPHCNVDRDERMRWSIRMEAAYEYANGVDNNNEAAKNWRDLIDKVTASLFEACAASGRGEEREVSEAFFLEVKQQVRTGFDTIICLEANKRELARCESLQ